MVPRRVPSFSAARGSPRSGAPAGGPGPRPRRIVHGEPNPERSATIARMAVTDDRPVADQLAELGAQLAWVRDYL
jgi:hypothetical protein